MRPFIVRTGVMGDGSGNAMTDSGSLMLNRLRVHDYALQPGTSMVWNALSKHVGHNRHVSSTTTEARIAERPSVAWLRLGGLVVVSAGPAVQARAATARPAPLRRCHVRRADAVDPARHRPPQADEVNVDKYDYIFSGNVKYNGEPLDGVQHQRVAATATTRTSRRTPKASGRSAFRRRPTYTITLDEETLPKGVIVDQEG